MTTLAERYQSEAISKDAAKYGANIPRISDQRVSMLANAAQLQSDETAAVAAFIAALDDTTDDLAGDYSQIRSVNRTRLRGIARKQWRDEEIQLISNYITRGATNQNEIPAELLDRLIEQVAADVGSNFATLMTAITAANTARNA